MFIGHGVLKTNAGGIGMSDVEKLIKAINMENGITFIQFCLEQLKIDQSIQTIWQDWQKKVDQSSR